MKHLAHQHETICAISTASGEGAIGVVRISGPQAFPIVQSIFSRQGLVEKPSHTLHFGTIVDGATVVDEVVLSLFKGPHSYTGEDVIEISCHGSNYILGKVMELLTRGGAQAARAGEFTMRAFANGKMDLSQAEAVADLIASDSAASHRVAMQQMRGGYSKQINALRQQLIDFASLIELELDFSEEDVEFANRDQLSQLVEELRTSLGKLIASFATGNVIKSGVPVAIVGEPNAGKSTLLNALLNEDRALVSDIAGTTRDVIEDEISIGGIKFRFIDTAGMRDTDDKVESMGIEKTYQKIEQAAVVVQIIDAVKNDREQVQELVNKVKERLQGKSTPLLVVANKIDQLVAAGDVTSEHVSENFEGLENVIYISAKGGDNVELIGKRLLELVHAGSIHKQDIIVTNARHHAALQQAKEALDKVAGGLETGISGDFLAMDIRQSLYHLGEITGEVTTDDLLGNIFGKFCIGK
jgi:tRNA modification GTPase